MTRHDSPASRLSKTWLGLVLGGGCFVASAGEPAAMSVTTRPFLPEPVLIQERPQTTPETAGGQAVPAETILPGGAAAGSFAELHEALAAARERLEELSKAAEAVAATGGLRQDLEALKEENRQLVDEIHTLRAGDQELRDARQAAEARVDELSGALEAATAQAQQIDEELIAARWENAQLNTSVAQARAAREEFETEARQTQQALSAKVEMLEADGEETATVAARLREQLKDSEQQLTVASRARAEAESELTEMRSGLQQAKQETARAGERLAAVEEQLRVTREREQRVAALQDERDELRTRLATFADQLSRAEAANARLETEVAELREAAATATDVARQNLMAVEQQIRELNEALSAIAGAGASASGPSPAAEPSDEEALDDSSTAAQAGEHEGGEGIVAEAAASEADADLEVIKAASPPRRPGEEVSSALLFKLPLEQRLHVQGLLADLDGTMDEQGLKMVVPGGVLFARDSEEVQGSAHDTLAKVAELINIYDDRQIHIVGHTDALGDPAYNKTLSERRAGLVKQFFVEKFAVEEARLATEGVGENRPIASNATPEGRRANRRVEVLILD